jgi:hypothetical protein
MSPMSFAYFFLFPHTLSSPSVAIDLQHNNITCTFLGLWMLHYFHRSIIYTYNAPSMSPSSILSASMALVFNACNGRLLVHC